jgi:hypothetical protein
VPVSTLQTYQFRTANVSSISGQQAVSSLDLVDKFWTWLCSNQLHLHTAFESVEQTLILNDSKDRLNTNVLMINKQKTVWSVSIEVLKSQLIGQGRGARLLHKLSEEVFAAIRRFREAVLSSFSGQQESLKAAEFDQAELLKVKNITKMMTDLGLYSEAFEVSFLE